VHEWEQSIDRNRSHRRSDSFAQRRGERALTSARWSV
jgi:hypothetical protein